MAYACGTFEITTILRGGKCLQYSKCYTIHLQYKLCTTGADPEFEKEVFVEKVEDQKKGSRVGEGTSNIITKLNLKVHNYYSFTDKLHCLINTIRLTYYYYYCY